MQEDGNFAVYGPSGYIWHSKTWQNGAYVIMQTDGNLVVYNSNGKPTWDTHTFRTRNVMLIM